MGRRDRKLHKRKRREERLRREKHERRSRPQTAWEEGAPAAPEESGDYEPVEPPAISPNGMERMHLAMEHAAEKKGIQSAEEYTSLLQGFVGRRADNNLADTGDPRLEAQEYAFQAMEAGDPFAARARAQKALQLDPDCVDALCVMAQLETHSEADFAQQLAKAVEAGERALGGPSFLEENKGHFWGIVRTRPYMRARLGLAVALWNSDRREESVRHFEALLELNPNDNQGVREILMGHYLAAGDLDGARRLFERYEDCVGAVFAWARVLERFLSGDREAARKAAAAAREENAHVAAYLTGRERLPQGRPSSYTMGSREEAIICVDNIGKAWAGHPEAIAWLMEVAP